MTNLYFLNRKDAKDAKAYYNFARLASFAVNQAR